VRRFGGAISLLFIAGLGVAFSPADAAKAAHRDAPQRVTGLPKPDLSARKRLGKASFYARQFFGKTMANGAPMNPRGDNAASRTLPLGTVAKVTNVTTGKSAIIRIEDRGPYIKGRIVDLSPSTAHEIGITKRIGVAKVVVAPLAVPLPDGTVKLGRPAREQHENPRVASNVHHKSAIPSLALR
jgi:rare lipoprotein A